MTLHDDRIFIRHFSWVLLALVGITIFFIFLSFLIVGVTGVDSHSGYTYVKYAQNHPQASGAAAMKQAAGAAGTQGGGAQASAAASSSSKSVATNGGSPDGQTIWKAHCSACHATGVAGAPKIGDKKAWGPILAKTEMPTLYKHAINGFHGERGYMPPKGGASSLSDAEVKAAVDYMVKQSGGHPGS